MLWGGHLGAFEVRSEGGSTRLRARFPYGVQTELAPGRFEVFAPGAFASRLDADADIHLLSGHDFEKPLASRAAGTLALTDTDQSLVIDAHIDPNTTWARDFIAAHASGLIRGLSPGFRVPKGGERIEQRGDGLLRTIVNADLFELSAVTVPAYPAAQIEARAWAPDAAQPVSQPAVGFRHPLSRWRA